MLKDELRKPQRQAWLGVAVLYVKNLRIGFNIFLAMIVPMFAGWGVGGSYMYFALAVALVALGIIAYLQYRNFFFQVVDDKFIINQGVLKKEELSVPFSRIQSVHIKQNIIQQILRVVALEIDTAGSTQKEVGIPALTRSYAEALKSFLLERKAKEVDENREPTAAPGGAETPEKQAIVEKGRRILHLNIFDLFKVGVTENHLRTGLIALGVVFGYFNQLEEVIAEEIEEATRQVEAFVNTMAYIIPIGIVLFLALSVLLSLIRTVLRYFNLSVFLSGRSLTVDAGLLKRQENVVPANKIQYIIWKSNPLRKLIGYQSLAVYQASSGEVNRRNAVTVPGCRIEQIDQVNRAFFPELIDFKSKAELKPKPFWQLRLLMFFGVVPTLAIGVAAWFFGWYYYIAAIAYLALADFFIRQYVKRFLVRISDEMLQVRRGFVFPQQVLLKHYKIQNLEVRQSIFQKRRELVTLVLYTAGCSIRLPFVPEDAGRALADFLLYKIESSHKEWM
jgi:putative membrane protein